MTKIFEILITKNNIWRKSSKYQLKKNVKPTKIFPRYWTKTKYVSLKNYKILTKNLLKYLKYLTTIKMAIIYIYCQITYKSFSIDDLNIVEKADISFCGTRNVPKEKSKMWTWNINTEIFVSRKLLLYNRVQ